MTATMARSSAGAELRAALERELVSAVGAFNPFVARLVEEAGFKGVLRLRGGALKLAGATRRGRDSA